MNYDIDALIKKGVDLNSLGKYEKAIMQYNKVLKMDPENIVALHHKEKGLINLKKKYEESISKIDKATKNKSKNKKELRNKKPKIKKVKKKKHWWSWR